MKTLFAFLVLFALPPICFAQKNTSEDFDKAMLFHYKNLLQGYWVGVKDTNETMLITKDSIFQQKKYDNKKLEDMHLLKKSKFAYTFFYYKDSAAKDSSTAAPGMNPRIEKLRRYYIRACDRSHKRAQYWTEPVYSISEKYLSLGKKGEQVYKRVKETKVK